MLDFKEPRAVAALDKTAAVSTPAPASPSLVAPGPGKKAKAPLTRWQRFAALSSPGVLSGANIRTWLRVLREQGYDVNHPYWVRAAMVSIHSLPNTVLSWLETLLFGPRIRRARIEPPLFVLGVPRSGTTHLHNLLTRDSRFAYPTFFEVLYPNTFLVTEWFHAPAVSLVMDRKRPMDNVRFGVREPQEDEWAFASLIGRSVMLIDAFPRQSDFHGRYRTLKSLSAAEQAEWKAALLYLMRKLSYKYGKPLVLKSPGHTGRVKTLLEMFPDARFVHIRRNPYVVFQSSLHLAHTVAPGTTYQTGPRPDPAEIVLQGNRELTDAFFEDRRLIPAGRLHEVNFEELERDPLGEMRRTYEALSLPDFAQVEPALRTYVESLQGYQKNQHRSLAPDLKQRVADAWHRQFEEWGYER